MGVSAVVGGVDLVLGGGEDGEEGGQIDRLRRGSGTTTGGRRGTSSDAETVRLCIESFPPPPKKKTERVDLIDALDMFLHLVVSLIWRGWGCTSGLTLAIVFSFILLPGSFFGRHGRQACCVGGRALGRAIGGAGCLFLWGFRRHCSDIRCGRRFMTQGVRIHLRHRRHVH